MNLSNIYKGVASLFLLAIMMIGCYFGGQWYYKQKYQVDPRTDPKLHNQSVFTTEQDVIRYLETSGKIKPKTYTIVKWKEGITPDDVDTLISEAKKYWYKKFKKEFNDSLNNAYMYAAQTSTSYEDSLVSFGVSFYSPIPIHPESYFEFYDVKVKEKKQTTIITNESVLPYQPSFWDRFGIYVGGGFGYDPFKREPTINAGIYIGFEIKKLF